MCVKVSEWWSTLSIITNNSTSLRLLILSVLCSSQEVLEQRFAACYSCLSFKIQSQRLSDSLLWEVLLRLMTSTQEHYLQPILLSRKMHLLLSQFTEETKKANKGHAAGGHLDLSLNSWECATLPPCSISCLTLLSWLYTPTQVKLVLSSPVIHQPKAINERDTQR